MRKKEVFLLFIFFLGVVSATTVSDDLHLNIQTVDGSGNVVTGTFDFVFNITNSSDCSDFGSVIYSHSVSLTTDSRGVISYYLPDVNLNYDKQYWLCYYREGSLKSTFKMSRVPYSFRAKNTTLSGIEVDKSLDMGSYNITAAYLFGNGSQLTGVSDSGIWSNISGVATYIGNVNATGTINAASFVGDGSGLTGIVASSTAWNRSGSDVFLAVTGDNVGIGTSSPSEKLHISDSGDTKLLINSTGGNGAALWLTDGSEGSWTFQTWNGRLRMYDISGGAGEVFAIQNGTGNVGIGTTDPQAELHIDGVDALMLENSASGTANKRVFRLPVYQDKLLIQAFNDSYDWVRTILAITHDGNVGIGTTSPQNTLNVIGDINFTGLIYGDGSQLTGISGGGAGNISAYYREYDTGWVACSDWTNQHLGDTVGGNVTHGFNAPLSNLTVRVLISTDGTDANSFEVDFGNIYSSSSGTMLGLMIEQIDTNNIKIQTAKEGIYKVNDDGTALTIDTESWYYKVVVTNVVALNSTPLFGGTPAGAIMAFNSETCPNGWIACDGTSGTPDLRGLFIRGAGTNSVLKYANDSLGYFSATYGEYQNDSFQGHDHEYRFVGGTGAFAVSGAGYTSYDTYATGGTISDGTNGDPRTGAETRPASYVLTYCMKTTEDTTDSNTIWGSSGDNIFVQNISKNVGIGTTTPNEKLEVIGNANITGNLSLGEGTIWYNDTAGGYYFYNGSIWGPISQGGGTGGVGNVSDYYREYDTGWVACSDWTNQHLGDTVGGNVTHGFNAPLSNLTVKIYVSTDGTDDNSFEIGLGDTRYSSASDKGWGTIVYAVDNNNIKVQTGRDGITITEDSGDFMVIDTESYYYKIKVTQVVALNSTPLFGGTPASAIMAFNSETCPNGWIACDGTSGTPDLRGLFVRGAGTNSQLSMANGSDFSATFGTYQNDSMQQITGYFRDSQMRSSYSSSEGAFTKSAYGSDAIAGDDGLAGSRFDFDSADSTAQGGARTGAETRPASYVLTYCMKTTEDTMDSNTIWATSGDDVVLNNQSKNVVIENNLSFGDNGGIERYDTGWISCSDWSDQHLGDTVGGNVNHGFNCPLSELLVRVYISTDGTDANAIELNSWTRDTDVAGEQRSGYNVYYVDSDNIKVQTGDNGIMFIKDDGDKGWWSSFAAYYKIKIWRLG